MNDVYELFAELFCDPAHEQAALLYLASLLSETESLQDYRAKMRQLPLIRNFLENAECPDRNSYLQMLGKIEKVLECDRVANGWNTLAVGDQ